MKRRPRFLRSYPRPLSLYFRRLVIAFDASGVARTFGTDRSTADRGFCADWPGRSASNDNRADNACAIYATTYRHARPRRFLAIGLSVRHGDPGSLYHDGCAGCATPLSGRDEPAARHAYECHLPPAGPLESLSPKRRSVPAATATFRAAARSLFGPPRSPVAQPNSAHHYDGRLPPPTAISAQAPWSGSQSVEVRWDAFHQDHLLRIGGFRGLCRRADQYAQPEPPSLQFPDSGAAGDAPPKISEPLCDVPDLLQVAFAEPLQLAVELPPPAHVPAPRWPPGARLRPAQTGPGDVPDLSLIHI